MKRKLDFNTSEGWLGIQSEEEAEAQGLQRIDAVIYVEKGNSAAVHEALKDCRRRESADGRRMEFFWDSSQIVDQ